MEKSYRKCAQKASPRPFIILVNNPKQLLHANYFENNILKEAYQKALKKLISFFLLNPVPSN